MATEWLPENKYNSFNSFKGLAYYEHYKKIVGWLDDKNPLPPPIEVNLDPYAECNISCYFCITQRYLKHHRAEVGEMRKLPAGYMHRLVDFLADWGVKGLCVSGGGEASLHEATPEILNHADGRGMKVSLFTNAVNISDRLMHEVMKCQWITISVDAGDRETYERVKGRDKFDQVVANIKKLANFRQDIYEVMLTWCSLVLPENLYSLHEQCKVAKESGAQVFRVRPVDFERCDIEGHRKLPIDVEAVKEQFERCHEEETSDFKVYTTTHKFDENFHVAHRFKKCMATPLLLPILTDGNGYLCVDHKMEAKYRLGSAYPNPKQILEWWGSDAHRDMMQSADINGCSRCTFGEYHRQISEVVMEDRLCLSFP
ncbi:hypothetical protein LCGC14_0498450 [marine sediment metagenome]|uniref:Radical SAM core domain-containing protein n=1 Tax=marine sediment metagenome TaxID=412755 RepID=A0A0F9URH6_9ZZZZ